MVRTFNPSTGELVDKREVSIEEEVWVTDRATYDPDGLFNSWMGRL